MPKKHDTHPNTLPGSLSMFADRVEATHLTHAAWRNRDPIPPERYADGRLEERPLVVKMTAGLPELMPEITTRLS